MKKRVDCECGWHLETDDEDELVEGVRQHAQDVHQMTGVTREQVLAQAKPVLRSSSPTPDLGHLDSKSLGQVSGRAPGLGGRSQ